MSDTDRPKVHQQYVKGWFNLPMLVRSKKEIKYRNESQGINFKSNFRSSFLS